MNTLTRITRYLLAGILVAILGGLLGWYVFIHRQVAATSAIDAARGLGTNTSFGGPAGSTFQNGQPATGTGSSTVATGATGTQAPRLWQVTPSPVAGMGFFASTTRIRFVERATGNVLEADPSQTKVTRITNTLFPKVYEADVTYDGEVLLRSQSDTGSITTFVGDVASTSEDQINTPSALLGVYLTQNISAVAVNANAARIFFLAPTAGGVSGLTSDWKGVAQKKLFASALIGWQAQWLADGKIYVTQNASDNVTGYAFQLSTSGSLTPMLGGLPGLSILPRSGSGALLYSTSANGVVTLYSRASAKDGAQVLPIHTVADKCVWSPWQELIAYCAVPASAPSGTFVRDWYAGIIHTKDSWWRVDVSLGTAEEFFTTDSKYSIDVSHPLIDEGGGYITFINNLDKSLWMLKIDK